MKKLLLLAGIAVISTAVMLTLKSQHKKNEKQFVNKATGKADDEDADATGMAEYFYRLLSDPATGKIDLVAYYKAMSQTTSRISERASGNLGLQWNFIGPDNIGGRCRAILFDKNNQSTVFAGGVSGGLWVSQNGGQSWKEWIGSAQLQNMLIVTICQDDSGYIYFGTGEGCAGLLSGYGNIGGTFVGDGVWKSTTPTDANTTYNNINFTHLNNTTPGMPVDTDKLDPTNATWSETNRLAANPHAPDSIIAATVGGIMVSGNGGKTWTLGKGLPTTPKNIMGTDVKYSIDGKKVFAAVNANPNSGSSASLYYSTNGGASFTKINGVGGFPKTDPSGAVNSIARIEIAVSPSDPNYAYAALISLAGINYGSLGYVVRTTNGGATWDTIGIGTGSGTNYTLNGFDPTYSQGVYDIVLVVSPIDNNTIFLAGTVLDRWSASLGWQQISEYGSFEYNNILHADIHGLVFDPLNNNRLLIGCDGGICQTLNPYNTNATGVLFTSLNRNFDVTQFYSVYADSQGRTIGGTQDNSVDNVNFLGNTNLSANQILGGDGGSTLIASNNTSYFGTVPALSGYELARTNIKRNAFNFGFNPFVDHHADSVINKIPGGQFILPIDLWEDADSLQILNSEGKQPIHSLMAAGFNKGEVWITQSALNFGTSPTWFWMQFASPKITGDVTAIKFSPDGKNLYVGTDAGTIYRFGNLDTLFSGKNTFAYPVTGASGKIEYNWFPGDSGVTLVQSSYTGFSGRIITSISIDPNNHDNVVITSGNYGSEFESMGWIAKSTDATTTFSFTSAQGSGKTALPYGPVYSSCILNTDDGVPSGTILAGTQYGIWSSQDFGTTWAFDNDTIGNLPIMSIRELPYYGSHAIYAGSYGRGLWTTHTFTTGINTVKAPSTVNNLIVFPNPLSGTGHIEYTLAKAGKTIINLYDITGRMVKNIANENMNAGTSNIQFNVADLVSGTYIVDVIQGNNQATAKLVVLH